MLTFVSKVLRVRPGEWPKVLILSAHSSLAIAVFVLVESLIVALFLEAYDTSLLPYLFTTQALFFVVISAIHTSVVSKVSRRAEISSLLLLFMLSVVFSRIFLALGQRWFVFALYVWMQTLIEILLIQTGVLVMGSLDTREAKRLFSVIDAGGTLGAVFSGFAVSVLSKSLGTENLLIACLPLLGGMIIIGNRIISLYASDEELPQPAEGAAAQGFFQDMKGAFSVVLKDRLLVTFLVILVAMTMASTVVDFQFKSLLKTNYSRDDIAAFLGVFYALLNGAALLAQLFVTSLVLISFGLVFSIVLMPVFLMFGSALFMLFPVLWVIAGTRFMENVLKYSVFRASSGLIYMPFPRLKQRKLRVCIGGVFKPFSVLAASLLLILLGSVELRMVSIVVLLVSALGILASVRLKDPYLDELKEALSNRRIRLKAAPELRSMVDRQAKELIEEGLASQDKDYVLFSLEIIRDHQIPVNMAKVEALFQNADRGIVEGALKTVRAVGYPKQAPTIIALLQGPTEPEIKTQCIRTLRHLCPHDDHSAILMSYVDSPDPQLCTESLIYILVRGNKDAVDKAGARVKELLDSGSPENMAQAAIVIGETRNKRHLAYLGAMFDSSSSVVKREAVIAAGKLASPDLLPGLIDALRDRATCHLARKAIANYDRDAVQNLMRIYRSSGGDIHLRSEILNTLGGMPCQESAEALTECLLTERGQLQYAALRSLGRMRQVVHGVTGFKERLSSSLKQEVERGHWGLDLLRLLRSKTGALGGNAVGRTAMLADEIGHRISQVKQGVFRRLGLIYDHLLIYKAYLNYVGGDKSHRANSLELLDNIVDKELSRVFLPLLEDMPSMPTPEGLKTNQERGGSRGVDWCKTILKGDDEWLKAVAIWAAQRDAKEEHPEQHQMGETMLQTIGRIYFLKSVPLFSQLSGEELRPVAEMFSEVSFTKGSTIFKEREPGDSFYVILGGTVTVKRGGREIAVLREKDYFGEMALLDYEARSATLVAASDCELLKLNRDDFHELLEEYPRLSREIIRTLARRLRTVMENMKDGA